MQFKDIMLDLECTDSNNTAAIISIGAVYFNIKEQTLGPEFYTEINLSGVKKQLEAGRTLSLETLAWWMEQSDSARNVWVKNQHVKMDIVAALHEFSKFCRLNTNSPRVWGNGSDYDNITLGSCYRTFNIKTPWSYSNNRCYRTIKNLFNSPRTGLHRQGTHHNGLDDAKTQAIHLMKMFKDIKVNT